MKKDLEKKQLGGLFRAAKSGIKAAKSAYKAEKAGKTLADLKEVEKVTKKVKTPPATKLEKSRASAMKQFSKKINKPATKAAESKATGKTKSTKFYNQDEKKYTEPKSKKTTESKPSQRTKTDKYITRGAIGTGLGIIAYNLIKGKGKSKPDVPTGREVLEQQAKKSKIIKGKGRYSFSKGGSTKK